MQLKKKISGCLLFAIYLLAGIQSIGSPLPSDQFQHQHEDFETVHHEHGFHIGIFHFLGHLLEKVSQQDDLTDDYIQPAISLPSHNEGDELKRTGVDLITSIPFSQIQEVNINDPPNSYLFRSILKSAILATNPLRGPPSFC